MIYKSPLFGILLPLLITSCKNKAQHSSGILYSDFPEEKQLLGETIELDTAVFRYAFRIRVNMGEAAVMDLLGSDHYFHVFNYPEFQYLNSTGKRGDSPAEMLSAENIRYIRKKIWVLDSNKSELVSFGKSLFGDSLLRLGAVKLDKDVLRALDFAVYDDSTYIITDYSGNYRFCWVNRDGQLLRKTGSIPSEKEDVARPALAQAWRSFIDYNPQNGVLATVTQLGEVIEIYNLKDSTHIVCIGPNGEPEFRVSGGYGIPIGIMGFSDVQVTDNAIYTVFHGRSFKDIAGHKEHIDGGKYIYVFNLNGEPIRKYILDRAIYGIYVDERRGVIVATDVNNDQPIVRFQL